MDRRKMGIRGEVPDMSFQEIMDEITAICQEQKVRELYLFGSYATGTATDTSDIDIVVKGVKDMSELSLRIEKIKTLKKIDIFDYDNCKNENLREAMERYGKKIY